VRTLASAAAILSLTAALPAAVVHGAPMSPRRTAEPAALDPSLLEALATATPGARSAPVMLPVEILTDDNSVAAESVVGAGGIVTGSVPGAVVQALVPAPRVAALAASPGVSLARSPLRALPVQPILDRNGQPREFGPTSGEGAALTGADTWHTAGFTGVGVKVGIVDFFDLRLWNPAEHGPVPSAANGHAFCKDSTGAASLCIGSEINSDAGAEHGVAVAEIIKDMAPDADLYIAQVATATDLRDAIDFFAANGVTVLSRSLITPYDGAGDGSGPVGEVIDYAAQNGMTWFNAAGNEAEGMYMRIAAADADGDRLMEFADGDELLRLDGAPAAPGVYCYNLDGIRWSNDWYLADGQLTDYRVEVYDVAGLPGAQHDNPSSLVPLDLYQGLPGVQYFVDYNQRSVSVGSKIGTNQDPLEMAGEFWCNTSGVSYLQLRRDANTPVVAPLGAPADTIEIAMARGFVELDYGSAAGSASKNAVDSKNAALVSVGAIDPPASGVIARYSSQGPTIDQRMKPEVAAHACVLSTVYNPRCFNGTSAATPEAAGMAALLQGAGLAAPGAPLAALVRSYTVDRGAPGPDNAFGYGELKLPAPPTEPVAPTNAKYVALSPARILDTRPTTQTGPPTLRGPHAPGRVLDMSVLGVGGVPASGVSAVAINLASVGAPQNGYLQALPTGKARLGATASLNVSTIGAARSNFAIVPVGDDGRISVYMQAGGHATIDVLGYFDSTITGAVTGGRFVAINPERWTSTRDAALLPEGFTRPRQAAAGEAVTVRQLAGSAVDLSVAKALVVYVAAAGAGGGGFLRAEPTGAVGLSSATVNYSSTSASGNTAIIPLGLGTNSISVFTSQSADVFVDVVGFITDDDAAASTAGQYVPITPGRAYSTVAIGAPFSSGETRTVAATGLPAPGPQAPAGASAVSANLAVAQPGVNGFLKAFPPGGAVPATASVNYAGGKTASTGNLVGLDAAGQMSLRMSANGQVFVDINGYFTS
jgi:Subtilase family